MAGQMARLGRGLLAALVGLCALPVANATSFDVAKAQRFAELALDCVHREYPNKIGHVLNSDADVRAPRALTPAFYGCYDWHSSVHGHWLLARLSALYPDAPFAAAATGALTQNLAAHRIAIEAEYLRAPGRGSFERPYGLAWVLQLAAELRSHPDPRSRQWVANLLPLEREAMQRLKDWLPKLTHPIRTGEHSQTAFAFGLALDWARVVSDAEFERLIIERGSDFYLDDRDCPLEYEPSGQDFLSPCIAEADFMRRILPPDSYAKWLKDFMPQIPSWRRRGNWLEVAIVTDKSDGKLAHLDGLNLSRAWMLEGIASGLPGRDRRRVSLELAAQGQADAGLAAVTGEDYAGGHWLASFATYLATRRGTTPYVKGR
jgi:hypothetical protein